MSKGDICPDGGRCPGVFVRGQMFVIVIIIMYNSNSNVFKNGIDRNISDFYRAMLCIRSTSHGSVSVRTSGFVSSRKIGPVP